MKENRKKTMVAVIFGGNSSEYGVSLSSASAVLKHMDLRRFTPLMIGISNQGEWFYYNGTIEQIKEDNWCNEANCKPARLLLEPGKKEFIVSIGGTYVHLPFDIAFQVMHGKNGEDGTIQGMLELAGVEFVGCKTLASALCMDKERAHKLVSVEGIRVAKSMVLSNMQDNQKDIDAFIGKVGLPVFIKPLKAGSSYGITKVGEKEQVMEAIALASSYDQQVIIEENIEGFEVGCAIIGTEELIVGEVDEIELTDGFFDYTEKYTLKSSKIHVPARIPVEMRKQVKDTAKVIYRVLGCSGLARVDLFITPEGELVFNEVNTIPGFTEHSRFPNMMKEIGFTYEQLITKLLLTELEVEEEKWECVTI